MGEEHLTKDCPIKQRLETKFCINCQVYGHMANWYGCPCFPKPPKGTAKINRNSYTNLYNSLIRPNLSYAQATSGKPTITNKNPQQMAPRRPETSRQTETVVQTPPIINRNVNPQTSSTRANNQNQNVPNINTTNNNSDIKALLSTTVQCLIQLLNAMNTTPAIANNFDTVSSAQADANQINDRPTSNENYRAFGGTLILVKNSIKHYSLPTPSMQTIEATIVILTPIDHDPISIVSIYIPPRSDEYTFTIDIESLIQTSSNCVLFGDFNAPHTAWNCNTNSSRGVRLLDFVNMTNLYIAYPDTPTRYTKSEYPCESILDNFTENSRPNNDYDDVDELINNTVNSFLSLPTFTTTETAYPSEIISYIKKSNSKKRQLGKKPIIFPILKPDLSSPMRVNFISRHAPIRELPFSSRHELRNPHDPGNYTNDWLDQSAASYMLAGYSPQSFLIFFGYGMEARFKWFKNFKVEKSTIDDESRSGRPVNFDDAISSKSCGVRTTINSESDHRKGGVAWNSLSTFKEDWESVRAWKVGTATSYPKPIVNSKINILHFPFIAF
ncbi:RNA-directed DNA polymerase from mobile element jockey [Trichonephila clavipes]|nr:RNA-directed DNA polymerase from mobile element jockey [Trichonephila clavipes]